MRHLPHLMHIYRIFNDTPLELDITNWQGHSLRLSPGKWHTQEIILCEMPQDFREELSFCWPRIPLQNPLEVDEFRIIWRKKCFETQRIIGNGEERVIVPIPGNLHNAPMPLESHIIISTMQQDGFYQLVVNTSGSNIQLRDSGVIPYSYVERQIVFDNYLTHGIALMQLDERQEYVPRGREKFTFIMHPCQDEIRFVYGQWEYSIAFRKGYFDVSAVSIKASHHYRRNVRGTLHGISIPTQNSYIIQLMPYLYCGPSCEYLLPDEELVQINFVPWDSSRIEMQQINTALLPSRVEIPNMREWHFIQEYPEQK